MTASLSESNRSWSLTVRQLGPTHKKVTFSNWAGCRHAHHPLGIAQAGDVQAYLNRLPKDEIYSAIGFAHYREYQMIY